jgi:hypothetical protein
MPRFFFLIAMLAVLIAASSPSFADDQTIIVYPRVYNFPGQQLCQVDRNDRRYREFCSPQSYHPFGVSGYRPFGTYQPYRSAQRYWVMPSARIVTIDP